MKKRLAIVSSHPIQYNAPMFALLARSERIEVKVFYTWSQSRESLFDKDFGHTIQWDIPLLEGYPFEFAENISKKPGPGAYRGIICPGLNPMIRQWKPDALMVYGWNYHAHFHAMKYFKGKIPVWFRGDSTLLDETGGPKQMLRRIFLRYIYSYADNALYVGENNRQYFMRHGFDTRHLFFAPHAIDNQRFADAEGRYEQEALQWRTALGIGEEDIVILFVGKFEPKKDPLLLIRAALALGKPGVNYIFAGNGALEAEMKELTRGNPNFHFIPFQNQSRMPVVYRLGDLLALPSQGPGETWGLVVNEAMACGKAVLVSNRCGCAIDLVKPEKNGFILEAGNIDQCISLLKTMTDSKAGLKRMGMASANYIREWSFEAICKSLETYL